MTEYEKFIESKRHTTSDHGIKVNYLPDSLFDFQAHVAEYSIKKGRCADFLDTGLGKTLVELVIATNYVRHTNKPALIITPLAVAFQFIKEAEKFGIDDIQYSKDGKYTSKIVVCNYERLDKFNANDFDCVILDECFAPNTMIQVWRNNSLHNVYIKDVQIGDNVVNCTGLDRVKSVKRKKVSHAIRIRYNGQEVISSPRHPYFTQRGWVAAQDLRRGDAIVATDETMRILRGEFHHSLQGTNKGQVLRSILFSEMANETTPTLGKSSQSDRCRKAGQEQIGMVENSTRSGASGAHKELEPDAECGNEAEGFGHIEGDESQTFSAWGQWSRNDIATAINEGCTVRRLDSGICHIHGKKTIGLPYQLQSRLSQFGENDCDRSGWSITPQPKGTGQKEGRETSFFGVESFEVLEQGHSDLDEFRDADGSLYFIDLEIERHPSFTINGGLVHNSSILKNFDGAIKGQVTSFLKKVKYRFLFTATPSPNDYIELGTSSEALGYLGYTDMLTKFFKNNNNNSVKIGRIAAARQGVEWYLKPHAERDFWRWIASWSISIRKPSDIGYSDERHVLPELIEHETVIRNQNPLAVGGQHTMFALPATNFAEIKAEVRSTINERCEMAVSKASQHDTSVYWVNLNDEADLISKLDPSTVEVKGKMNIDEKEDVLLAFSNGDIKKLITKTSITAFGLNWQHCNHTTYFPTYSYEQYYQAIRRFWRFGQKNPVNVDLILSDGQTRIMESLMVKKEKATEMFENLTQQTNSDFTITSKQFDKQIIKPSFI